MPPLTPDEFRTHLLAESARFHEVLNRADPALPVPSCPEWNASDLAWHLAEVQDLWAWVVTHRPQDPDEYVDPARPVTYADVLAFGRDAADRLHAALAQSDPTDPAWSWSDDPSHHTVGWIHRRQAHEALIHRVDAELTVDDRSPLDQHLAADGVDEVLDVMYGGQPTWASWTPLPRTLRLDLPDSGAAVWVQWGLLSGEAPNGTVHRDVLDAHVVALPADPAQAPDAVLSGLAATVDLWLWHRGDDEAITASGDAGVLDDFRGVVAAPID